MSITLSLMNFKNSEIFSAEVDPNDILMFDYRYTNSSGTYAEISIDGYPESIYVSAPYASILAPDIEGLKDIVGFTPVHFMSYVEIEHKYRPTSLLSGPKYSVLINPNRIAYMSSFSKKQTSEWYYFDQETKTNKQETRWQHGTEITFDDTRRLNGKHSYVFVTEYWQNNIKEKINAAKSPAPIRGSEKIQARNIDSSPRII